MIIPFKLLHSHINAGYFIYFINNLTFGGNMKKLSLCFALMLMVLCALPNAAEARKSAIVLKNKAPFSLYATICYQDTSSRWRVKGWYTVKARSSHTLHLDTNNTNVYIFARNQKHNLYYRGKKSNSADRNFYVTESKLDYVNGRQKPSGKGLKQERFDHFRITVGNQNSYTFNY